MYAIFKTANKLCTLRYLHFDQCRRYIPFLDYGMHSMLWCFGFLTHDRYSCKVIKRFNYSVVTAIFTGWKLFKIIYMAENYLKLYRWPSLWLKISRRIVIWIQFYMKWTVASHNLSGYCSNSLIVHCFIHLRYHLEPKWMLADHSLNQLLLKLKVL